MSIPAQPSPAWTDNVLDPMRQVTDPLADAVVAEAFQQGQADAVNTLMRTLIENDDLPSDQLPQGIREYLATSAQMPAWVDPARIQAGERVFWRYGPEIIMNLFCYGLPSCYAGAKGVQVLALTTRLFSNPTRRVIETAQMVIDVMAPGGLAANGRGIRTAQKVRLMHAAVRYQIATHHLWNPAWDRPINQEDLAGTLLAFSWVCLDGLRQMGFQLSVDEAESYLHSWNVVGHLLGIREALLPTHMAHAEALVRAIQRRQYAACAEGQMMTRALVAMMQHAIPGNIFDAFPAALIRLLLGEEYADLLAVERHRMAEVLLGPWRHLFALKDDLMDHASALRRLSEIFSRKLIEGLLLVGRGGQRVAFSMPTELRQTWGINWVA
jgi:ER-bound oxygenase mpaB/B'/Rubber oxygenase, catalytic domain